MGLSLAILIFNELERFRLPKSMEDLLAEGDRGAYLGLWFPHSRRTGKIQSRVGLWGEGHPHIPLMLGLKPRDEDQGSHLSAPGDQSSFPRHQSKKGPHGSLLQKESLWVIGVLPCWPLPSWRL